jgi:hypothetical protein
MSYTVKEVHIEYLENKISLVAVLWVSNPDRGWMRASYCTNVPIGGYKFLLPKEELSPKMIQEAAGQGMNLPDNLKKQFFPKIKKWER